DGIIAGMTTDGNSITGVAQFWQEPDQNWQIVGQGDFDGDGIRDFVWQNSTTGQVYIMLMSGPTTIKAGAVIYTEPNTNWKIVATADFNGDGKAELLWWNSSTGQVYVMPMNGLSVALGGSLLATGFDPTWHIQGETEWRDNLYGRGVTTTTK
ncbi:MAG: VCBS repeat-containing protein, partial [Desulfuromonadales bacterium]